MADETIEQTNSQPMEVMLGELILPVPPRQMRIRQELKIDEIDIPGRSGKIKQPVGYQDSQITIDLEICDKEETGSVSKQGNEYSASGYALTETALERFKQIQTLFRKDRNTVQQPVPIVSPLTEACGIQQVLIKELEIHDNELDYISCTLNLTEFESVESQIENLIAEEQAVQQVEDSEEYQNGVDNMNSSLGEDDDYLIEQFQSGKADAMGGEYNGESPADDNY